MGTLYGNPDFAETAELPKFPTAELDDYAERYRQIHAITDPDEYMAPLKKGGRVTERRVRQEFRARGWLFAAYQALFDNRRPGRTRRGQRGRHA